SAGQPFPMDQSQCGLQLERLILTHLKGREATGYNHKESREHHRQEEVSPRTFLHRCDRRKEAYRRALAGHHYLPVEATPRTMAAMPSTRPIKSITSAFCWRRIADAAMRINSKI